MKAQRSIAGKHGLSPKQVRLVIGAVALVAVMIVTCATNHLAGAVLIGIAAGIALAIALRLALNFDPEE